MSKSRYLKASELGIPHKELRAFIWVKNLLQRGVFDQPEGKIKFDIAETAMNRCDVERLVGTTVEPSWCGTAACIGGWVGLKMFAEDPFSPSATDIQKARNYVSDNMDYTNSRTPKGILFFDNLERKDTPLRAAAAIETYLTTGTGV